MVWPDLFCELSDDYDPVASYDTNKMKTAARMDEAPGLCIHLDFYEELEKRGKALTVKELAQHLNASENFIRKAIRQGKLPCIRAGDLIRLNPAAIVAWLRARDSDSGER
jgi:excisionase family DNA binding protein